MKQIFHRIDWSRWLVLPPILVGVGVVALFVINRRELDRTPVQESVIAVEVQTIELTRVEPRAKGFGTARPSRTWTAVAEVPGTIVYTHPKLDAGDHVDADEVLLRIDDTDYQLRVNQRTADVNAAQAMLEELAANQAADEKSLEIEEKLLRVTKSEWDRQEKLALQNATSSSELDRARSSLLRQTQSVQQLKNSLSLYPTRTASARAAVATAKSRLKEAKRDLSRTEVKSPYAGVLANVNLEDGQVVNRNEVLFQLQDVERMEVDAQFSLSQLDNLAPTIRQRYSRPATTNTELLKDLTARLFVRSGNLTLQWGGKPIRISDSINQQTRTLGVIVEVDNETVRVLENQSSEMTAGLETETLLPAENPSAPLRSGTFCEVLLKGPAIRDVVAIPRSAIDGNTVYVVENDNQSEPRLRKRLIKPGFAIGDLQIIEEGLVPGDQVVVKPPLPAIIGQAVKPIEPKLNTQPSSGSPAEWSNRKP